MEQVWDTTTTDSTSEELAYFSGLKFAVPTATSQIHALPLQHMLDWLLNLNGPSLMEGEECNVQGHLPRRAFALLAAPRFLYGPGGTPSPEPMIGVGMVLVPPYVQKLSFRDAYFFLNQCVRVGSKPLKEEQVVFLRSSFKSTMVSYMQPYPLWLDYATEGLIKKVPKQACLHCFQAFCLHRIVAVAPEELSGLALYVYTPRCRGHDPFLEPNIPEVTPESSVKWAQWNVRVTDSSDSHWSLLEDKTFDAHPAQVQQDRANKGSLTPKGKGAKCKNPASKGGSAPKAKKPCTATKGGTSASGTLMKEARLGDDEDEDADLLGLTGALLDTLLSAGVKEDVDTLLGSIRSYQLQALYKMGSVRMVDRALTKGFTTEFMRLSRVVTEDLSKSLCNLHKQVQEGASDLEAFMYKLASHPLLAKHSNEITAEVERFK